MATDRRIYASMGLFCGPTPATGSHGTSGSAIHQIHRVQSINYNFNVARQDVNVYGKLGALSREIIEQPTVGLNFDYLDINAVNESGLGFIVDGTVSAVSGIINGTQDEKNYFILVAPDDEDAVANASADSEFAVIGIGNGFLNSYTARGAVGGLPSVSVGVEALNFKVDTNRTGQAIPAVDPVNGSGISTVTYDCPIPTTGVGVAALRPGDITITITADADTQTGLGVLITDAKIQSYEFAVPLTRTNLSKLGSKFAFAKKMQYPLTATASVAMDIGDYQTGSLATLLCNDNAYEINVAIKEPTCVGVDGATAKMYILKNAKLVSQDFSSSIGPNNAVTMNFESQVGGAEDVANGFFCSGILV